MRARQKYEKGDVIGYQRERGRYRENMENPFCLGVYKVPVGNGRGASRQPRQGKANEGLEGGQLLSMGGSSAV